MPTSDNFRAAFHGIQRTCCDEMAYHTRLKSIAKAVKILSVVSRSTIATGTPHWRKVGVKTTGRLYVYM